MKIEELINAVNALNPEQRRLFDEIVENIMDPDEEKEPFHIYLAGEAGTGKSHLVKILVAAVKHLLKKSPVKMNLTSQVYL